jgi:hypothetical protein
MIKSILNLQDLATLRIELLASAGKGDRSAVHAAETAAQANPTGVIQFDAQGFATISADDSTYAGGRFELVSLGELARRVKARGRPVGPAPTLRLSVLTGADPLVDIGALQATADRDTLFQVASQFNCLEAPGQRLTTVANYFGDSTQGPRASISAFPGTIVRHYAAPRSNGDRFVQTATEQIDLLEHVCPAHVAKVKHGYLTSHDIFDPHSFAAALETNFDKIQVGVHEDVEVVLGLNWDGLVEDRPHRRISQVFTSTFAGGGYSSGNDLGGLLEPICRQLLRAAYLGTLLAAASHGKSRVVLTLIGGGVFANPHSLIWEAILWAIKEVEAVVAEPMDVVVNAWVGFSTPRAEVLARVEETGGVLLEFEDGRAHLSTSVETPRPGSSVGRPRATSVPARQEAAAANPHRVENGGMSAVLLERIKAAKGKVVDDDQRRGRIIIKLPPEAKALATELQRETGGELTRGFKNLVLIVTPRWSETRKASHASTSAGRAAGETSSRLVTERDDVWVAVADLHGHRGHFQAVLQFLDEELGDKYRLCTLGDYVDNGAEVPALLDDLIALKEERGDRFVPIIGNHDLAMIRSLGWPGNVPDEDWFNNWRGTYWNHGLGTPELYAKVKGVPKPASAAAFAELLPVGHPHRAFLEGLPWFHDSGEFLFVHAGMERGLLEPQRQALSARQLPKSGPFHSAPQLRAKELSKVTDSSWDRVVVSAHSKSLREPYFNRPNRICLSGEVDTKSKTLYAVVLTSTRSWLAVGSDLHARWI